LRFCGNYYQRVDQKGRTSVPAEYRSKLEASEIKTLFIAPALNCLEIYPESDWEEFVRSIEKLSTMRKEVEEVMLSYISPAFPAQWDSSGRILLPQNLRELVKIDKDKEVVIVGMGHKFQIWDKGEWEKAFNEARSRYDHNRNLLSGEVS